MTNTPTKGTGMASMLAVMIVVTVIWLLDLYGIKVPEEINAAWQGGLTILLAYFIHDPTGAK